MNNESDVLLLFGVISIAVGIYANYLYATTAKMRWGAKWADPITAVLYRVVPDESWPKSERRRHALLRIFKRVGLILIAVGIIIILAGLKLI